MKKSLYLLSVVVSGLLSSSALALTPIGPPVATLKRGQFATGFSYSHSKFDIEGTVLGLSLTIEDVEVETYMVNLLFGLDESFELQFDLGASMGEYDEFGSSGDFAGGFGLKTTFAEQDKVKWGAAFMMHWYEANGSGVTLGIPWTEEDDWTEIQIALGPSYKDGPLCLYGGPLLHFIDGDAEGTIAGIPISGDIEQDSIFGGFVGANVDLSKNITFGIEYQITGSSQAIGASIHFAF